MKRQNDFAGIMGEKYKEAMKVLCPNEMEVTAELARRASANYNRFDETSLLDLGCGGGEFLQRLAMPLCVSSKVYLTGIDNSSTMIEKARRQLSLEIAKGKVRIVQADLMEYLQAMNLTGQTADVITSNFVLHNFTQQERAMIFPLIYQSLSPNGVLLMEDKVARTNPRLHARDLAEQMKAIESLAQHGMSELIEPWKQHYEYDESPERIMTFKTLGETLGLSGFKDVRISYVPKMEAIVEARK